MAVTSQRRRPSSASGLLSLPDLSSPRDATAMAPDRPAAARALRHRTKRRRPLGWDRPPDRQPVSHATSGGCRDPRWLEQRRIKVETAQIGFSPNNKQWKQQRFQAIQQRWHLGCAVFVMSRCCHSRLLLGPLLLLPILLFPAGVVVRAGASLALGHCPKKLTGLPCCNTQRCNRI